MQILRQRILEAQWAAKRADKEARIDGSSNEEIDDGSKEMAARVEFSSEKYQVKPKQPGVVDDKIVGGMMGKLAVDIEGQTRTERWEVGRVKSTREIKVALPEGGTTVSAYLFTWQKLDAAGRASGDILTDLSLDLAGCGPKGEWAMVEPKPIALPKSAAGRPSKRRPEVGGGDCSAGGGGVRRKRPGGRGPRPWMPGWLDEFNHTGHGAGY